MFTSLETGNKNNQQISWEQRLLKNAGRQKTSLKPEYQELKFTLHRKLVDKINLEALATIDNQRVKSEVRADVHEDVPCTPVDECVQHRLVELQVVRVGVVPDIRWIEEIAKHAHAGGPEVVASGIAAFQVLGSQPAVPWPCEIDKRGVTSKHRA